MTTSSSAAPTIPAHVPANLVRDYPFRPGAFTQEDPFERIIPEIHAGPAVIYAPLGYLGFGPAWVFRRSKDLQAIYQDTEHFSSKDFAPFAKLLGDSWSSVPAETDPPMHGLYRAMANPLFTPKRMAEMDAQVRQFARGYIDKFKTKGQCEFMTAFAFAFPIAVFLELMGLPLDKLDEFLEWEHGLLHEPDMAKIAAATLKVKQYLMGVIEERRREPRNDLISFGIQAKVGDRQMTQDELFGFCFNLFIGGLDTVSTNLGLHFRYLAEHRNQQNQLRQHPEQIPAAVEELLRAYAAVTTARTCVKPISIADVQIMPGDKVLMATTLANRDPEAFDHPNEVRLDRNPRHISFGNGIHRCLGAPLARRELTIAMEEFLREIPEFGIAPGVQITTHMGLMIQPVALPLAW